MGSRDARREPACACGGRGMPRGSVLCLEHASLLGSLQLRPSVGAPAVCVVLRAALGAGCCDLPTTSLRPPWPLLNSLLPSPRASSLICRTTR